MSTNGATYFYLLETHIQLALKCSDHVCVDFADLQVKHDQ
jgi:hypothetical protein